MMFFTHCFNFFSSVKLVKFSLGLNSALNISFNLPQLVMYKKMIVNKISSKSMRLVYEFTAPVTIFPEGYLLFHRGL